MDIWILIKVSQMLSTHRIGFVVVIFLGCTLSDLLGGVKY